MQTLLPKVQSLLQKIPKGKVSTYGDISSMLGNKKLARAVGNALNKNSDPDKYPCCLVVKSDGSLGGFATGIQEKIKRLKKFGVEVKDGKIVDFEKVRWRGK